MCHFLLCHLTVHPLTACQKEYQKILRRWRQPSSRYIPRCSADGSYAQVQCAGGVCFCVSPQGKEIPGTKTVNSARQPNCTHPGNLQYLNYISNRCNFCFHFPLHFRSASYIFFSKFINAFIPEWIFHSFWRVFVFRCQHHTLREKAARLHFLFKEIYSFLQTRWELVWDPMRKVLERLLVCGQRWERSPWY